MYLREPPALIMTIWICGTSVSISPGYIEQALVLIEGDKPVATNHTMSAIGPKQTSASALHMSAFGSKADMTRN